MSNRGRLGWWVLAVVCGASACGQDLALPTADGGKAPVTDTVTDGTTGVGGANDEAQPAPRLPVPDKPAFGTFGGEAGDDTGGVGGDGDDTAASGIGGSTAGHGGGTAGGVAGRGGSAGNGGRGGSAGNASHGGGGGSSGGGGSGGGGSSGGGSGSGGASEAGSSSMAGFATNAGSGSTPGTAGADGSGAPPSLLFSEYVEGSGSYKALEIYAVAAASLEGCELQTYFNGKLEPSRLALHGSLAAGAVQVLCSTALASAQLARCDRSTNLTFNGDDAIALSCGGVLLDVIGQIGVDPGDAWGDGATADHTLRRRCSVTSGRTDGSLAFDPDPEWLVFGIDTFSDLGAHDCAE